MQKLKLITRMRKDLYTFIHWAIETAMENHHNSHLTYEEYIRIAVNVWRDMDEDGELDRPIKKKDKPTNKFKSEAEFKAELDRQKKEKESLAYAKDFFKQATDNNMF